MKRIKTAIQVSEVSFLLFTIKHLYILQPNRQRLPLALETYGKLKEQSRGAASGDIFARHLAAHQRIWN